MVTFSNRRKTDAFDQQELLALANFDIEQNRLEEALHKLKEILAQPEPLPRAYAMIARLYAQLGLLDKAQSFYQKYLELNPNAVHERFELGMTYFDKGEIQNASQLWTNVLAAQPTHTPALFYSSLVDARQGRLNDARHRLDILLKSTSSDNLYFNKAKELLQKIDEDLQAASAVTTIQGNEEKIYKTEH